MEKGAIVLDLNQSEKEYLIKALNTYRYKPDFQSYHADPIYAARDLSFIFTIDHLLSIILSNPDKKELNLTSQCAKILELIIQHYCSNYTESKDVLEKVSSKIGDLK